MANCRQGESDVACESAGASCGLCPIWKFSVTFLLRPGSEIVELLNCAPRVVDNVIDYSSMALVAAHIDFYDN